MKLLLLSQLLSWVLPCDCLENLYLVQFIQNWRIEYCLVCLQVPDKESYIGQVRMNRYCFHHILMANPQAHHDKIYYWIRGTGINNDYQYLGESILCLIPRTTVTSLSAPKDTRCKTHPLCVNPGVPVWTREKTHKFRARWQACSSGIRADVTVVLEVRQSIVCPIFPVEPCIVFITKPVISDSPCRHCVISDLGMTRNNQYLGAI